MLVDAEGLEIRLEKVSQPKCCKVMQGEHIMSHRFVRPLGCSSLTVRCL
jgi:hypothetical protein